MAESNDGVTLIICSGDMDKVMAALIIATGAAASGKETNLFFTFWGYKAIQKGNLTGSSFFGKMLGIMNRGGITRIGPSRFNFWGIGRWMFNQMMKAKKVTPMDQLLQTARDLGIKFWPCQMTMEVMEIKREDLLDWVEEPIGVASMLEMAYRSHITMFI